MTESCTTTPRTASPNLEYLTVKEAAGILRRKTWPIVKAIEAGELRASLPGNDGCWLIQPSDLAAYVELYGNDVPDGLLESAEVRNARDRAEIEERLAEEGLLDGVEATS